MQNQWKHLQSSYCHAASDIEFLSQIQRYGVVFSLKNFTIPLVFFETPGTCLN